MSLRSLLLGGPVCAVALAGGICAQDASAQVGGGASTQTQRPHEEGARPGAAAARQFIEEMTIAGMTEVQLGKMAEERGMSQEVKAFGQLMVKDHTQANKELAEVAAEMKVTPPTQLDQKHRDLVDKLSKLQGAEFDREYMSAMVSGHEEVAGKLKEQASHESRADAAPAQQGRAATRERTEGDTALTQWAAKTLPVVEQHLKRAREVRDQLK